VVQEPIYVQETHKNVEVAFKIFDEVKKAVYGKDEIILKVLIAILARGHILLEDIPGVGKTTLAMAFSKSTSLAYNRVQFTPDVMPSDITGYNIYKKSSGTFEMVKGAALCNLFLADEINRTSSKTQSALLEVMEEGFVTVDLKRYETPKPFTVIATQNPVGHAGTQMLPESQLDRFMMRLSMGYPAPQHELNILKSRANQNPLDIVKSVANGQAIMEMQEEVDDVYVEDSIYSYIIELINKTRNHELIELGISPRGAIALAAVSRARAYLNKRDYVLPVDVQTSFIDTASHRIILKPKARLSNISTYNVLKDLLSNTNPPVLMKK